MRQLIHTTDICEHASALSGWEQRYDQLSRGRLEGLLSMVKLDEVEVFRERLNQSAVQQMRLPEGVVKVLVPLAWPQDDEHGGHASVLPDLPAFRVVSPVGMDVLCVSVPHGVLRPLLDEECMARLEGMKTMQALELPPAALAQGAKLLLGVMEAPEQVARSFKEQLVLLVVEWLEGLCRMSRALPGASTRRYIVERCHEWLMDQPEVSPSVLDLCQRLKVSRRTLQYSFQSIAAVTPVQYLRSLRLNGARRSMQQEPQASIADIAAKWGFGHSSYFSLEYQKLFGELPSAVRRL